ncbi:aspartyl-tRNA(Asn)/glutamyl-tRNA(Gln) amidotransferase subunit A [Nonomuraea solani]|uniref:Aspartyl-tRNA(Asn)/glutamyl-tRNA(Gln) amidotransferase subunit A n=1 Tax=Nonomuraea solani TaxID=1144553 RepID=A0A1H6EGQ6_9ACTN|nr:amidase [Nonomuraea solani]SEG97028.1 aspartyl-tRNA(Asn)/glutamyl-tRNA(Gln) amidotransferase subunit A [Nonomuraea solani]
MPTPPGPFTGRTLIDLARDLRDGSTTAAELTGLALDAIAALDPGLNAFVTVDAQGALDAARRADEELAGGTDRGPLHGIPVGVKDLIRVAGLPATMGSRHFAGYVPDTDAACVTRLRRAGAVIAGKTTTHEFAYGATGDRSANGPSRNPWDPSRMSGGSSGGSTAAVAAGMIPLALGTDTGGSVRIPAALCGIAAFKPAYGAIAPDGVFPLSRTFDHVGVLASDAAGCRLAYAALTSPFSATHSSTASPSGAHPSAAPPSDTRPSAARVAWLDPAGLFDGDARVTDAVRAVAGPMEEVRLPVGAGEELREIYSVVVSCEAAEVHAERLTKAPELFGQELRERLGAAATLPGWRYVRAMAARERPAAAVRALFDRHDVLALPAVPFTAPPLDQRAMDLNGRQISVLTALFALTSPWNVLGLPALSVPAGLVDGLPVGLQLVCRPGNEHLLFETAITRAG